MQYLIKFEVATNGHFKQNERSKRKTKVKTILKFQSNESDVRPNEVDVRLRSLDLTEVEMYHRQIK